MTMGELKTGRNGPCKCWRFGYAGGEANGGFLAMLGVSGCGLFLQLKRLELAGRLGERGKSRRQKMADGLEGRVQEIAED